MGAPIGQIPSTLIAARREPPVIEPAAPRGDRAASTAAQPNSTNPPSSNASNSTPATETPQAGFGPGTVSGPAAALVTLGRSVRAARETIPTLDEIRAQFQARRAAQATARAAQTDALRARLAERRSAPQDQAVPAADTLGFNRFNEARGFTEIPRTEPLQPTTSPPGSQAPQTPELASARPPDAPEFASAPQPDEQAPPPPEPDNTGAGPVPAEVQRRRLDLTA